MPLFGHKNKNRNTSPLGGTTRTDPVNTQAAAGSNPNTGSNWDQSHTGPNANRVNEPGFQDPNSYGAQGVTGHGSTQGNTGFGANEHPARSADYASGAGTGTADAAAGTGAGTGMGGGRTHHHHGATGAGTGQGGQQGGHLSSAALREQALLKEREAQDFHAQSAELAEAERLEQEAREHRTRAVAQGAHPSHKHLAGGNTNAQGGQNAGFDQSRTGNY
ncbi:hypothetical protein PsYK624_120260 [Phanerochaete sordida]|uniref:Uncharacterized protein n=1 Tax=Phanerochaete sordida TaxID=48140 RepID=A0A9P3GJB3_9APHY|nr:hypothetical protein PsYK624_120260 [Phanerochaete sordida]